MLFLTNAHKECFDCDLQTLSINRTRCCASLIKDKINTLLTFKLQICRYYNQVTESVYELSIFLTATGPLLDINNPLFQHVITAMQLLLHCLQALSYIHSLLYCLKTAIQKVFKTTRGPVPLQFLLGGTITT